MEQLSFLTFKEVLRLFQIGLGIIIMLSLAEIGRRKFNFSTRFNRKFVHISIGVFVFFSPLLFINKNPILVISSLFTILDYVAYKLGWLKSYHSTTRRSYGTTYYPLSLFILTYFLWDISPGLVVASMMPMILGDAAAGIVGESIKHPHEFSLNSDKKSIEGSIAMSVMSIIGIAITWFFYHHQRLDIIFLVEHNFYSMIIAWIIISLFATAWEAISSRGLDNLTVPLSSAFALYFCFYPSSGGDMYRFMVAAALGLLIAFISFKLKFLKASGFVATFILATIIYSIGGWMWTTPILAFFILSSLLSKFSKSKNRAPHSIQMKGDVRDYVQVIANGGIPGVIILISFFYPSPMWYILYLVSIAAVTADTWSSEIGMLSKKRPVNIITFKSEEQGASGAISLLGTIGGLVGAFLILLCVLPFVHLVQNNDNSIFKLATVIVGSGMVGNFIDSILGATIQAQFVCAVCLKKTENIIHCNQKTTHKRRIRWFNNDIVNIACGLSAVACAYLLYRWLLM